MATPVACVCDNLGGDNTDSPLSTTANIVFILTFAYILIVGTGYGISNMRNLPSETIKLSYNCNMLFRRFESLAGVYRSSMMDQSYTRSEYHHTSEVLAGTAETGILELE